MQTPYPGSKPVSQSESPSLLKVALIAEISFIFARGRHLFKADQPDTAQASGIWHTSKYLGFISNFKPQYGLNLCRDMRMHAQQRDCDRKERDYVMAIEKSVASASIAEVIDRILDKGIVVDAFVRVSLVGIELIAIEARVVVASIESWLKYAEAVGLTVDPAAA